MGVEAIIEGVANLKGVFDQLTGAIKPFVDAISPSTVMAFNQAMKDVQATIGSAVVSSLQVFASVLREVGGVILPLMQALEPILHQLAEAFGGYLVGVVRVVVAVLEALVPVFQILADATTVYLDLLTDFSGLLVALIKTLSGLFSDKIGTDVSAFKEAFKGLADIVRQVVKALATFIATILVGIGQRGLVERFAKSLENESKARDDRVSGLMAAATNSSITDIQGIGKAQQMAAFIAAGGGAAREKTDTEWLKDISASLKDIADKDETLGKALSTWWNNEVVGGPGLLGKILRWFDGIAESVKSAIERISRW